MRLVRQEIDKSVVVKLDRSIRAEGDNVKGIMKFGEKNDYPQIIEQLINNSSTAKAIARIYSKFLVGQGFENEELNKIFVGKDYQGKEITLRNLLSQISMSIAYFNGFYLHCNINILGQIGTVKLVPFKYCRFAKIDDTGYTAKIGVYNNWERDKNKQYNINKIAWYPIFNRDKKIILSQIRAARGIKNYPGQIYFHFFDNTYLYPLSMFDPVYMDIDTEYQIQLFKNRTIRNGLLDKTVFRVQSPSNDLERQELKEGIERFLGADGDSVLVLEDEIDAQTGEIRSSGAFRVDQIKSNINDKLFETWEKTISNNIRKAASSIPAILIDYEESKLGTTSGEAIIQATNFYNSITKDNRNQISEIFQEIFVNSSNEILSSNKNWRIKPLNLYESDNTTLI